MENRPPCMVPEKAYTICVDSDHLSKVLPNGGHSSRVNTSGGHLDTQERHSAVRVDTSHCVNGNDNGRIVSTSVFTVSTHVSTRKHSDLCSLSSQDTSSVSLLSPQTPVSMISPDCQPSPVSTLSTVSKKALTNNPDQENLVPPSL